VTRPVSGSTDPSPAHRADGPSFAHASEAEFARILDFYAVRWEYEPHTFPILWSLDGSVVESFSPDFWLPDLELYVELTTLKQSLVRKKNRKLRRLRELYPDVRIKLFYGRDFRALMLKYGKLGLVDGMTGATGQASPVGRPSALVPVLLADMPATELAAAELPVGDLEIALPGGEVVVADLPAAQAVQEAAVLPPQPELAVDAPLTAPLTEALDTPTVRRRRRRPCGRAARSPSVSP
jgi:hypothetical protein